MCEEEGGNRGKQCNKATKRQSNKVKYSSITYNQDQWMHFHSWPSRFRIVDTRTTWPRPFRMSVDIRALQHHNRSARITAFRPHRECRHCGMNVCMETGNQKSRRCCNGPSTTIVVCNHDTAVRSQDLFGPLWMWKNVHDNPRFVAQSNTCDESSRWCVFPWCCCCCCCWSLLSSCVHFGHWPISLSLWRAMSASKRMKWKRSSTWLQFAGSTEPWWSSTDDE